MSEMLDVPKGLRRKLLQVLSRDEDSLGEVLDRADATEGVTQSLDAYSGRRPRAARVIQAEIDAAMDRRIELETQLGDVDQTIEDGREEMADALRGIYEQMNDLHRRYVAVVPLRSKPYEYDDQGC